LLQSILVSWRKSNGNVAEAIVATPGICRWVILHIPGIESQKQDFGQGELLEHFEEGKRLTGEAIDFTLLADIKSRRLADR
jgi:hypothetical protein